MKSYKVVVTVDAQKDIKRYSRYIRNVKRTLGQPKASWTTISPYGIISKAQKKKTIRRNANEAS